MYAPLVVAALTLAASAHGVARPRGAAASRARRDLRVGRGDRPRRHRLPRLQRPASGRAACPGRTCSTPRRSARRWRCCLSGLLGRGAERVRDTPSRARRRRRSACRPGGRWPRVTAAGLAGTVGEAGLLHFRGAYHNPAMLLPVTVPPVAAALLGASGAAAEPRAQPRLTRWWLRLTALLGLRRRRLPRLRRVAQHGRLAQLEPERAQRAAAAGAAQLHRPGARRPRRARR